MTDLPYEVVPEECGRFETVGASEGYYLLGDVIELPPWADEAKLLSSKVYRGTFDSEEDTADCALYWGSKLEDDILDAIADGHAIDGATGALWTAADEIVSCREAYRSKAHPRISASPDAVCGGVLIEAKNPNPFAKKHWKDGPQLYYQVQAQQQMLVTGFESCVIAVLFGNRGKVHCWEVKRHERMQRLLVERIEKFWERVEEARREAAAA